jgi:hypothetical protein
MFHDKKLSVGTPKFWCGVSFPKILDLLLDGKHGASGGAARGVGGGYGGSVPTSISSRQWRRQE